MMRHRRDMTLAMGAAILGSVCQTVVPLVARQIVDGVILEHTSNLDLATEARVAAAMQEVSKGRTTVIIAHRLQTARSADRIVVLHAGRVDEVGSHEELIAEGGRYAAMWEAFELVGHSAEGARSR
jgi:ATP-binding cassette subfamily B protein